jgi:flavin-dependent dehydrogenase
VVTDKIPTEVDVVVIGGGPAGLATAIAARRRGLDALVADRAAPPIDKACGEGLMPDGIAALRRLGVELPTAAGVPFRGIAFIGDGVAAEAGFPDGSGLGIRRTGLQRVLIEEAEAAGARLRWQAAVDTSGPRRIEINRQPVRFRWLIGADGIHSRLAQRLRLRPAGRGRLRIGLRQHYRVRAWTDLVEVHWQQGCQAYVTPVGPEEICVAIITPFHGDGASVPRRMAELVGRFPALARRLADAEPVGTVRGGVSQSTRLTAVACGNSALVGDASGSVDAVTGEGLALAFRQAEALAAALADGDLARYQRAHRLIGRRAHLMARLLLLLDRSDQVRRLSLRLLASQPQIFDRLLAFHLCEPRHPPHRRVAIGETSLGY